MGLLMEKKGKKFRLVGEVSDLESLDCYCQHLVELERCISEGQQLGAVIIAGDLNAHIGTLGGPRGSG